MAPRVSLGALVLLSGCGATEGTIAVHPLSLTAVEAAHPGSLPSSAQPKVVCDHVLEDLSGAELGAFPASWHTRSDDDRPVAIETKAYVVEHEDGRNVLHATYRDRPITIALPVKGWDLETYPIMQWSWRAKVLPTGADEREASTNDSTASVYVIWEIGPPFMIRGIRYAWSTTLPVGTTVSRRFGYDRVIVMNTGREPSQGWRTVQVNVARHYEELFERELEAPSGIAILTDADSTNTQAEAYYADFRICRVVPHPS